MARSFDGSSFIIGGIGGLVGAPGGAHTIAVIAKRGTSGTDMVLVSLETSANSSKLAIEFGNTGNNLNLVIGSSSKDTNVDVTTSDNWVLAAVNRATGTATPRGHKYVYDTGTWTHNDASATSGGDSSDLTGGRIQLGRWQTTAHFNGDMAVAAVWKRSLADAEIEALAFSLQAWYTAAPDALWIVDQAATGTGVIDSTGLGANQTSITGTSVSTSSVPVFGYGFGVPIPSFVAGGGGDATATPSAVASVVALPAVTVSAGSTATPAAVASTVALPATTVSAGSTETPAAVAAVVSLPAPTVSAGSTTTPAAVSGVVALPAPTVSAGSTETPNAIAAVVALPAVTVSAGSTVTPAAIAAVVSVPQVTVDTAGNATATPATIGAVVAVQSVTVAASSTATPATVAALVSVPQVSIPGTTAKATSTATVTAGRTSTAPVTAQRTSTPTVGG